MTEPLTLDGFKKWTAADRMAIYEGIGISILYDVSLVSDEELKILSWGFGRDDEMPNEMGEAQFQGFKNDVYRAVADQGDYAAAWELAAGNRDALEDMDVHILQGYPIVAPIALAEAGFAATAGPVVASAASKALQAASWITKVVPSVLRSSIYRKAAATIAVTGTAAVAAASWDKFFNFSDYEMLGEDEIAQAVNAQAPLTTEDGRVRRVAKRPKRTFDRPAGQNTSSALPDEVTAGVDDPSPGGQYDPNAPIPTGGGVSGDLDNPFVDARIPAKGYEVWRKGILQGGTDPRLGVEEGSPIYRQSDYDMLMGTMTEWQIDLFQGRMVRAGYMTEKQATGLMDTKTVDTLGKVLFEANANAETWQRWTQVLAVAGDEAQANEDEDAKQARLDAIGPFQRSVYLEPDYASLSTTAKNAVEQELGRKINDWEMQFLVDQQEDDYRDEFDAGETARLSSYRSHVRAVEEDLETGETYGGGTVQGVDPAARFQQTFQSKFRKELDRKDVTRNAEQRSNTLMSGLNNAMSAIGGR